VLKPSNADESVTSAVDGILLVGGLSNTRYGMVTLGASV
jgi:prophage tail gpP-like protein